jgi:hypothetical protein
VEYRIDQANLSNVKFDNGILTAKVNLTKAGVYPYLYSDGRLVKEAKLPKKMMKFFFWEKKSLLNIRVVN